MAFRHCNQRIIVFKNTSNDQDASSDDPYVLEFNKFNLNPLFIPTLSFEFCNCLPLINKLSQPHLYSALVLTSPRAIDAISNVLSDVPADAIKLWKQKCVFVVGKSSHEKCKSLLNFNAIGEHSGNAENLIPVIVENVVESKLPLLFPCGEKKISTISTKLPTLGLQVDELEIYKSLQHQDLEPKLTEFLQGNENDISDTLMIFFSPSGLKYVLNILRKRQSSKCKIRCVSIGQSTSKAIESAALDLCCTAEKPDAEHLVKAITEFQKSLKNT